MSGPRLRRALTAALLALPLLVFGPWVLRCGLYLDDYAFFLMLWRAPWERIGRHFLEYVPGRNLHILELATLLRLTDGSVLGLHAFSLALDAANGLLAFRLALSLCGLASVAFPAAIAFALMTHHGEQHFWINNLPQCQIHLLLLLSSFLLAARQRVPLGRRAAGCMAFYTLALATYDQSYFLWPLLLAILWARAGRPSPARPLLAAADWGLSLNLVNTLLRHLSPVSAGGRPVVLAGQVPRRFAESVYASLKGLCAPPSAGALPHWGWTALAALLALAAFRFALSLQRSVLEEERPALESWLRSPGPPRLALFGASWWLLAYLPNYFWFLSPRHNYLPSLGWALLWTAGLAWLAGRSPRLRRWLAPACALLFANACVAHVHEGSEWVRSAGLHRAFSSEASRFCPGLDNVFAVGAPRSLGRAPAFQLPHDSMLNAALRCNVSSIVEGDNQLAPTRRGAFYVNDLSLSDRRSFRWLPFEAMRALAYRSPASFRCAGRVRLRAPDGKEWTRGLKPGPGCDGTLDLRMEVALLETAQLPGPARRGAPVPGEPGLELVRASTREEPGLVLLELEWSARSPAAGPVAMLPSLLDAGGRPVYEPVYRDPVRRADILWPLMNDLLPPADWVPGRRVRELYALRLRRPLPPGPRRLRLELYRPRSHYVPQPLGTLEAALPASPGF